MSSLGAGPVLASLLAMLVYEKFSAHQPLNRLCERYALEGVPIALSTSHRRRRRGLHRGTADPTTDRRACVRRRATAC
ncbi:MAG: IS66 family transposase [Caulobacteraceae bacterium]